MDEITKTCKNIVDMIHKLGNDGVSLLPFINDTKDNSLANRLRLKFYAQIAPFLPMLIKKTMFMYQAALLVLKAQKDLAGKELSDEEITTYFQKESIKAKDLLKKELGDEKSKLLVPKVQEDFRGKESPATKKSES